MPGPSGRPGPSRRPCGAVPTGRCPGAPVCGGGGPRAWAVCDETDEKPGTVRIRAFPVERVTGIEPALSAWEAEVLPLNYTRAHLG